MEYKIVWKYLGISVKLVTLKMIEVIKMIFLCWLRMKLMSVYIVCNFMGYIIHFISKICQVDPLETNFWKHEIPLFL